jgi:hypothetical protein
MPDEPSQLEELILSYGRDKACLAAAELDLQELNAALVTIQERICHAERSFKHWQSRTDASYSAVRRRIDAQTETSMSDEVIKARCNKALMVSNTSQFINQP